MRCLLVLLSLAWSIGAHPTAQAAPPPELANAIPLGTGEVPGANGPEQWDGVAGFRTARNITSASVLPILPAPGRSTGAAVVVAPGGGFMTLAWDHEGIEVARVMAEHGIAAFVLKYRLDPTPRDLPGFAKVMAARMANWIGKPGEGLKIQTPPYAVADGIAALRLVHSRAAQWGVDPVRVGMIGFSAGARTTIAVALQARAPDRPAFIAPIYPSMEAVATPPDAPPMFVVMATDDPLFGRMGYGLIQSWAAAQRPFEFHAYQRGGHGFGLGFKGTTTEGWTDGLFRWIEMNGFLHAAPPAARPTAHGEYSTTATKIGILLDDPAAKAIVEKHIPGMTTGNQIGMAREMTLKAVQQYAPDMVTDARLTAIDTDFAKMAK